MAYIKYLLILILVIVPSVLRAADPGAPDHLRSCDKYNPVGVSNKPYFGWYVNDKDDNEIQSAYQIIIASGPENLDRDHGDIWNSGKVGSRMQNYVYAGGRALSPATRYYWKVRTWDKDGNVGRYSEAATFETGLFNNSDWAGAVWIKRESADDEDFTYFRKSVTLLDKTIRRAIVYISACHDYELYINGIFIGKGFMHHYPQYTYYHAWDIGSVLSTDRANIIACLTHWYGGGQGRAAGTRGLLMKTIIEYSDGTTTSIGTDGSWKLLRASQWMTGQPQRGGEGVGRIEMIDSQKTLTNWNDASCDDSAWPFAKEIGVHPTDPWTGTLRSDLTRVIEEEIRPVSVSDHGGGTYVIDLGKIYPGSFKITFSGGNSGDTVKMLGGYALNDDGTVSVKIHQHTNLDFAFILNGGTAVFNPFVYLGMRYLQVDHSPQILNTENVRFVFRHFELDPSRSYFNSSDQMLNRVWDLMCHSLLVGAQEGFVDTPTREKGTFLLDGAAQAVPAMTTMGDRALNLRVLNEFLDSQDQYWPDGRLNAVYPNADGARDIPDYTQAFLVWVWDYYMQTGNLYFLTTHYSRLKKIAEYVYSCRNDTTGLIHRLKGGGKSGSAYQYGIIDWPISMRYGYDMSVESRTVIDAYAFADFDILSKIAEATGRVEDSKTFRIRAIEMKNAMNALLINKDGVYIDGLNGDGSQSTHVSQHANMFPVALGIVPEPCKEAVIAEIKNRKMNVGMVSLRWLPEAIGQADQGEHLIDLYTNTEWDGWAKNITQGATVTWEDWNANLNDGSLSHPWGAIGLLAMQQYILGIKTIKPQHELIQVKPLEFGDKIAYAKGICPTDKGDILINWSKKDNYFSMTLVVPANIKAIVYVPKGGIAGSAITVDGVEIQGIEDGNYIYLDQIGSGTHQFARGIEPTKNQ
jgi:alpha-L-rhamnosidase